MYHRLPPFVIYKHNNGHWINERDSDIHRERERDTDNIIITDRGKLEAQTWLRIDKLISSAHFSRFYATSVFKQIAILETHLHTIVVNLDDNSNSIISSPPFFLQLSFITSLIILPLPIARTVYCAHCLSQSVDMSNSQRVHFLSTTNITAATKSAPNQQQQQQHEIKSMSLGKDSRQRSNSQRPNENELNADNTPLFHTFCVGQSNRQMLIGPQNANWFV